MAEINIASLYQTAEETEEPEVGNITGEIPEWLTGTYFRVGPSKFDFKEFTMNHLLDGYAMVSKFEITPDKKVIFEKKYLQTDAYRRAVVAEKPVITEFATSACSDPSKSLFSKFMSALAPEFTDNNYSTLFKIGPDLFSICDTCFFRQVDMAQLGASPEKHDSNKYFGLNSQSAHPLQDPETGDVWNIGMTLFTGLKYHVVKIPGPGGEEAGKSSTNNSNSNSNSMSKSMKNCTLKSNNVSSMSKEMLKKSKVVASIPSRWNGSLGTLHSFGMSANHIIFIEQPFVVSVAKLCASIVKRDAVKDWVEWRPEDKNRFVVVSKAGRVYKTEFYSKDSFYFMHVVNCFEEDGQIIVDINAYASPSVLDIFYLSNLRQNIIKPSDFPQVQRFIIPLIDDIKQAPENVNLLNTHPSPAPASAPPPFTNGNSNMSNGNDSNSEELIHEKGAKKHEADADADAEPSAIRQGNRIILSPVNLINEQGFELPTIHPKCSGKPYEYFYAAGTINDNFARNKLCKVSTRKREVIAHFKYDDHVFPGEPLFVPNPNGTGTTEEDDGVIIAAMTDTRGESHNQDFLIFLDKNMTEIGRVNFKHAIPCALHGIFIPSI